jgi:LemA protein
MQWHLENYISTAIWMLGLSAVFAIVLGIGIYNRVQALRTRRKISFADVDAQLRLRYDLVPHLVETVRIYAPQETALFDNVTNARTIALRGGSITDRVKSEQALGAAVTSLLAVAENYPPLKADPKFRQLQADLSDVENRIAAARRLFNSATEDYNATITHIPGVFIARFFHYGEEVFFELDPAEAAALRAAPKRAAAGR